MNHVVLHSTFRFNVKQPYAGDMIGVPLNQRTKFDIFGRLERDENR